MFDFLDRLRKKPAHTRRTIALAIAIVITLIIFSVWLFNLVWNLNHPLTDATQSSIESTFSDIANKIETAQRMFASSSPGF